MRKRQWTTYDDYPDWRLKSFVNFKVRKKLILPTAAPFRILDYNGLEYNDDTRPETYHVLDTVSDDEMAPEEPKRFYLKVRPDYVLDDSALIAGSGKLAEIQPVTFRLGVNHGDTTSIPEMLHKVRSVDVNTESSQVQNEYEKLDDVSLNEYLQTLSNNVLGLNNKVLLPVLFAAVLLLAMSNVACLSYCVFKKFWRRKSTEITIPRFSDPTYNFEVTRSDYDDAFSTDENGICKLYGLTVYDKTSTDGKAMQETPADMGVQISPLVCAHQPRIGTSGQKICSDTKIVIHSANQTDLPCPKLECKYVQIPDALLQPCKRPQEPLAEPCLIGPKETWPEPCIHVQEDWSKPCRHVQEDWSEPCRHVQEDWSEPYRHAQADWSEPRRHLQADRSEPCRHVQADGSEPRRHEQEDRSEPTENDQKMVSEPPRHVQEYLAKPSKHVQEAEPAEPEVASTSEEGYLPEFKIPTHAKPQAEKATKSTEPVPEVKKPKLFEKLKRKIKPKEVTTDQKTVQTVSLDQMQLEGLRNWMKYVFVDPAIYEMMPIIDKDERDSTLEVLGDDTDVAMV